MHTYRIPNRIGVRVFKLIMKIMERAQREQDSVLYYFEWISNINLRNRFKKSLIQLSPVSGGLLKNMFTRQIEGQFHFMIEM